MYQLPDGSIWQDNGDGSYTQVVSGWNDPNLGTIDLGTVTQVDSLPGVGAPTAPTPDQGTFAVGPINTPEEAAQIAAQAPLEAAPVATEDNPALEQFPKSLGFALSQFIIAGSTPEQAAAQVEALRKAQVKAGLSTVTADQLVQDARVIAATYSPPVATVSAPSVAPSPTPDEVTPVAPGSRSLQSADIAQLSDVNLPLDANLWKLPDLIDGKPTARSAWRNLVTSISKDLSAGVLSARAANKRLQEKVS